MEYKILRLRIIFHSLLTYCSINTNIPNKNFKIMIVRIIFHGKKKFLFTLRVFNNYSNLPAVIENEDLLRIFLVGDDADGLTIG